MLDRLEMTKSRDKKVMEKVKRVTYNHAVLGESLELCKDAAKWFVEEKIRLEKSRKANKEVMESIQTMVCDE